MISEPSALILVAYRLRALFLALCCTGRSDRSRYSLANKSSGCIVSLSIYVGHLIDSGRIIKLSLPAVETLLPGEVAKTQVGSLLHKGGLSSGGEPSTCQLSMQLENDLRKGGLGSGHEAERRVLGSI